MNFKTASVGLLLVGGLLLQTSSAIAADGLVICSAKPIKDGGPIKVITTQSRGFFAERDLKANGYKPSVAMIPGYEIISAVSMLGGVAVFYDKNIEKVSDTMWAGDQMTEFQIPDRLKYCKMVAEMELCEDGLPCE